MTQVESVTAEELIRALKRRKATLPAEIGSFVVLEACESLLLAGPRLLTTAEVSIFEDGSVRLSSAPSCSETDAARALHKLLASMLVAAGPAPLPALMRLLEQGPSSGRWTLASMRNDLEASLVPLNRNASRRVLSRLVREVGWSDRQPVRKPTFQDLDSELSSFLDAPARNARQPLQIQPDIDMTREDPIEDIEPDLPAEEPVAFFESVRPPAREVSRPPPREVSRPPAREVAREPTGKTILDPVPDLPQIQGQYRSPSVISSPSAAEIAREVERRERSPSMRPVPRGPRVPSEFPRQPRSKSWLWGVLLLALSAGVVIATLQLRPDVVERLQKPDALDTLKPKEPQVVIKRPAAGDLIVRVATDRAQILRFVGRGPVNVQHLPQGISHEFVAVSDSAAPARLLVPKDAEWESTSEGPRYEAAMQLGKLGTTPNAARELGETLLPQDVGSPSSTLGTVRIVTTPKGAKVYQVIGFAPEAKVESLPLDATQELLIYRKGFTPEVRVVAPSDYVEAEGAPDKKVATVSVNLVAAPKK